MTSPPADPRPRLSARAWPTWPCRYPPCAARVRVINARLDQAGLRGDLNLAARFEDPAQTVADALDAAAPRRPAAPYWIGLDRDTYIARLAELGH
jgi:hypothetical protein